LAEQAFSKTDYEVIVVDDGADQEVDDLIKRKFHGVTCRLLTQRHLGAAAARNAGAIAARGRYLAFTDDDCRPAPDWLSTLRARLDRVEGNTLIGGKVINELDENPYASVSQALVDYLFEYYNRDHQRARILTSNNICVQADAFRDFGGFDTAFAGAGGEDRELCLRWSKTGNSLIYAPEVRVYHAHDLTLQTFVRQHLAYGRGAAVLRRCALDHGYGPILIEPPSFYIDLLQFPQKHPNIKRPWTTSLMFALSQVANSVGYFHERVREYLLG
jgi:GT2 family glycosyltransferase